MRAVQWLVLLLFLLPSAVWASEPSYQAKYSISMVFGEEFYKTIASQAGADSELEMGSIEMRPIDGILYFDRQHLRLDMNVLGNVLTSIVNTENQSLMVLDHTQRTAWQADLAAYSKRYEEAGLPVMNMEEVFLHWEDVLQQLQRLPDLTYKDLGWKTVNGLRCHGISFKGNIEDVLKSGTVKLLPELEPLGDLRGPWRGEYWINEDCAIPVNMQTQMFGVTWQWDVTDLQPWDTYTQLFEIPRGYRIKALDPAAPFAIE